MKITKNRFRLNSTWNSAQCPSIGNEDSRNGTLTVFSRVTSSAVFTNAHSRIETWRAWIREKVVQSNSDLVTTTSWNSLHSLDNRDLTLVTFGWNSIEIGVKWNTRFFNRQKTTILEKDKNFLLPFHAWCARRWQCFRTNLEQLSGIARPIADLFITKARDLTDVRDKRLFSLFVFGWSHLLISFLPNDVSSSQTCHHE